MKENKKSVNELINEITQKKEFRPIMNDNSTGLSPDLSDEDIEGIMERCSKSGNKPCAYKYYYDEKNCILYKSSCDDNLKEYIGDCLWNYAGHIDIVLDLVEITEEEADDIIKELEGDEYDLVDGYVLEDFSGDV